MQLHTRFCLAALVGLLFFAPLAVSAADFVGASKCRACHINQAKTWETSKMAKAFELLKPGVSAQAKKSKNLDPNKDYTKDAHCLSCHVTGHGKPGGFESVEKTPNLAGVQCEACHGAGGGYLKPNLMSMTNKSYKRAEVVAAGLSVVSEKTCAECHNSKSPFYTPLKYEADKAKVHDHIALKFPH